MRRNAFQILLLTLTAAALSGCGVISLAGSVAGAVVDIGSAVVTTGVKAVGAVIPDGDDEKSPEAPASAPQ